VTQTSGPIGLFDSGVGGLTVVSALHQRYPKQALLYVADQAHVPYGDRASGEVRDLALAITGFLVEAGCRAVVMACNISSATALAMARASYPEIPIIGVINAAVREALKDTHRGGAHVGVLATQGTVTSRAYPEAIRRACPSAEVTQVACPALVPLIEAGDLDGIPVRRQCADYLRPLADAACETIILGCTHYPLVLPALRHSAGKLFRSQPRFVDPAQSMVDELEGHAVLQADEGRGEIRLVTTGDPEAFARQVRTLVRLPAARVAAAHWEGGSVVLE